MPAAVEKFKTGLKSGAIDPEKLSKMSSEERHAFFKDYVGNNAKDVNALFESKLLLKNQQKGMVDWASKVAGLKEGAKKDLISRISRMDKVLDPADREAFMKDLASTKLGVNVTQAEAKTIATLSRAVEVGREKLNAGGDRMAFGRAKVALANYVNDLKVNAHKLDYKNAPLTSGARALSRIPSNAKAINASMDNSAIFRQGWKTLWAHPGVWQKNAKQSFVNIVKQVGGKEVMDEVNADIVSRPTYDKMIKAKLAVTGLEEAFPTSLPEKIPVIGRFYKATEAAYTAFVQKTRADVFDKYLEIAEKSGVDINNAKELESIGKLVNSLTGRASLGKAEPVGNAINNVFFSPRFFVSNLNTLTHALGADTMSGKITPFAQKQAAKNLLKAISGIAAIATIANAVKPGSVELDPRSSDYGKIKIGHTRFDITGGIGSIMTLVSRVATTSSKSSTTGQVTKLNSSKFGAKTDLDIVHDFIDNKMSPFAGFVRDKLRGEDSNGNKFTVTGGAKNLFTPIGVQNWQQMKNDPQSANKLLTVIADGLGISANTYGAKRGDAPTWEQSDGKEINAFKKAVGDAKFKKASEQYDNKVGTFMDSIVKNKEYVDLSTEDQKKVVTNEKAKIQADIFKANAFKYKREKSNSNELKKFLK